MGKGENDKPVLLRAIEIILADPKAIKEAAEALHDEYRRRYGAERTPDDIADLVVDKIVSNYSYYAAFVGGAAGMAGVVPGLGQLIAAFGGATADVALTMKLQIEMTMAIASVYGHDITKDEEKILCFLVAGLGTIAGAAKGGAKTMSAKAFIKMTQQYLKGSLLQAVKEIFKKVGVIFTRKAVEKAIPFGVGVVIGFAANKGLTWYVGTKAKAFYKVSET